MVTALALFCCNVVFAESPRTQQTSSRGEVTSAANSEPAKDAQPTKPDSPSAKSASLNTEDASGSEHEASGTSGHHAILNSPVKPANGEWFETPRKKMIWYSLMAAGHGAAAFDAWTTRRAVSQGYGVEANPLERPFASSGAIYATTQVSPLLMDFVGRQMMRSSHPWMRRIWWVPQAASASFSFGAGVHNYRLVP